MIEKLGFDAATHYQIAHFTPVNRDYSEIIPDCVKEWGKVSSSLNIPYYPHVSMGWDNNPRFFSLMNNVVKNNPILGNNKAPTIDSNNFNLILTIKILLY